MLEFSVYSRRGIGVSLIHPYYLRGRGKPLHRKRKKERKKERKRSTNVINYHFSIKIPCF
jgi:hypothetical protein